MITTKPFKELASYSRFLNLLQFHAGVTVFLSSGHFGGFFRSVRFSHDMEWGLWKRKDLKEKLLNYEFASSSRRQNHRRKLTEFKGAFIAYPLV